jgi:predicted small lipoprotein YifL
MRRRARLVIMLWLMPSLLALALAGCGHAGGVTLPWDRPAPPAGITLTDLHDVGDLQTVFNQDNGKPRLIMLVSPT